MRNYYKERNRQSHMIANIMTICIFAVFFSIFMPSAAGGAPTARAKMLNKGSEQYRMVSYTAGDIQVSIHIGLSDNMMQSGRYSPVLLTLENKGRDFTGSFCLYKDLEDEDISSKKMVVKKELQIAAGETKQYTMLIKINGVYQSGLQTALCNSKGKALGHKLIPEATRAVVLPDLPCIGLIAEDPVTLSYLRSEDKLGAIEYIQDWMLTDDFRSLDSFDIIVINDFDTSQFSEKQIAAMEEWVEKGGTLVFGTGTQPEKTLKAFSSSLFQGTIGDVKQITMKDGKKLDISTLKLEQAETLFSQDGENLVSRVNYGDGCAIVASFDLNLADESFGKQFRTLIYKNYSASRREELQKGARMEDDQYDMDYDYYSIVRGLSATEINGLPNIFLYAALLLFYALLIGPILYSVLRKRGKREKLWKLIPALAVIFSVLIYLIGTSTRVKRPYINYLAQIDLSNPETSSIESYFNLTTPNNDAFTLELPGKTDISSYDPDLYMHSTEDKSTEYQYGIEYLPDKTKLHMDHMGAFDNALFQEKQKDTTEGRIVFSDLKLDGNGSDGVVTNNTNYDLEDCMIVYGASVVVLDDLKKGESVSLKNRPKKSWLTLSSSWTDAVGSQILNYDRDRDSTDFTGYRRAVLLERYGAVSGTSQYFFYGFLAEDQDTVFTKQFDLDMYGATAVVQHLTEDDLKNSTKYFVGNLDQYVMDAPDELKLDGRHLSDDITGNANLTVSYDLSSIEHPEQLQLQYRSVDNQEFEILDQLQSNDGYYVEEAVFFGTVTAVNQKTGKEETVITNGQEADIDLSSYIDGNGALKLNYQIRLPNQQVYDYWDGEFRLPSLALERRNAQ